MKKGVKLSRPLIVCPAPYPLWTKAIARLIITIWTPDDYSRFLVEAMRSSPGRTRRV